ncbi:MAG TPA: peptidase M28, partial [Agriterribacter sp.]|nr:peptidase M28 [Agriterribacter sp.]
MHNVSKSIASGLLILLCACNQNNTVSDEDGLAAFSADSMRQHISVLASDSFMGRMPFTEGEIKTIQYLQQQFMAMGLEPGNGSSYFQEVPMVNIVPTAAPTMQVQSKKGRFTLNAFDDYIIWTDKTDENINLDHAELVFAGYGVVAPEYDWND